MKKSRFILFAIVISVVAVFTTSCKKKGCTDPDAINYSREAEKDDGSCSFEGAMVFYYIEATAAKLVSDGAITMTYYVDGRTIGSSDANIYWTGPPYCGDSGTIGVTKSWANNRTREYYYSVRDQTGWEFWGGPITFYGNTCVSTELSAFKKKKK